MFSIVKPSVEYSITEKMTYGKLAKGIYNILKKKAMEYKTIEENIVKYSNEPLKLQEYIMKVQRRIGELENDNNNFKKYIDVINQIEENNEMIKEAKDDQEIISMIKEENKRLLYLHESLTQKYIDKILPLEQYDKSNCRIEIKQAVGGRESALFAEWLMKGYANFISRMNWSFETDKIVHDSGGKGIKNSSFLVNGYDAYKYFKHESGVHKYDINT